MARVEGIEPAQAEPDIRDVFAAQTEAWGEPLGPWRVYARRPSIFRAARGMWDGLKASGLIPPALKALVCRRVASLNGCVF